MSGAAAGCRLSCVLPTTSAEPRIGRRGDRPLPSFVKPARTVGVVPVGGHALNRFGPQKRRGRTARKTNRADRWARRWRAARRAAGAPEALTSRPAFAQHFRHVANSCTRASGGSPGGC